jgi:hypothetical protein
VPPAKDERQEVTVILMAKIHFFPLTPKVAPWLKAIQPHQSSVQPRMALVALPMGGSPLVSHLVWRKATSVVAMKPSIKQVSV